jgi:hypothetical protein
MNSFSALKGILKSQLKYKISFILLFSAFIISLAVLLPQTRRFIIYVTEEFFLYRKLGSSLKWMNRLFTLAMLGLVCSALSVILGLSPLWNSRLRKIFNKTEEKHNTNMARLSPRTVSNFFSSDGVFAGFVLLASVFIFVIAFSRAASTGITWDEALTYERYVLPADIIQSYIQSRMLNNHILNSLLIRIVGFVSKIEYNESLIRFPSLLFYCIYIVFSYLIARRSKSPYLVFVLFVSNYYVNEFFGLARGYGIACACITGAVYFFEKWKCRKDNRISDKYFHYVMICCSLAALSNAITLYVIFGFLMLLNFKYKKDILKISNTLYFLIFFIVACYTVISSNRGGESVFSSHNFSHMLLSIPFMFVHSKFLILLIAVLFILCAAFVMIKEKGRNDYVILLIVFCTICFISQLAFRRGYPVAREMIPFYPICVVIIANLLGSLSNFKIIKPLSMIFILIMCIQFVNKIDTRGTFDWRDNYPIRDEMFAYISSHDIIANKAEYRIFVEAIKTKYSNNPVVSFYDNKINLLLGDKNE